MLSRPAQSYGNGYAPAQGMQDPEEEGSLWDQLTSTFTGQEYYEPDFATVNPIGNSVATAHMNHAPAMMPIPWQSKALEKSAAGKQEKSHAGFDSLSVEQLQTMALTRAKTIEGLNREVKELAHSDQKHEERLRKLETQFGSITHNQDLKLKAPLLSKIRQVVRDSHLLDHANEIDKLKEDGLPEETWAIGIEGLTMDVDYSPEDGGDLFALGAADPYTYMHAEHLALGRGVLSLDQHHVQKKAYQEQLKEDLAAGRSALSLHYAGHVAKAAENVECVHVKEAGIHQKQPLHPAPYRNQFWLSLDGPTNVDHSVAKEEAAEAMADPLARLVARQDEAGTGKDAKAVDWLGQLKRGEIIDASPPPNRGFVMPSWMY